MQKPTNWKRINFRYHRPMAKARASTRAVAAGWHVALLRGINVGGNSMLPMRDLQLMFRKAGCTDVRTYIQSGNVVFRAAPRLAKSMESAIPDIIARKFGFRPAVMVRSAAQVQVIVEGNPFTAPRGGKRGALSADDARTLHVGFLADTPSADRVASLDVRRSPGDECAVRGHCIYLRYASGVGKTRLTGAYLESTLNTHCTLRNWRTMLALLEMMREPSQDGPKSSRRAATGGDRKTGGRGVTVEQYRRLCLGMPQAYEGSHMDHPDFRVRAKIFATLYRQERGLAMVKLKPPQQRDVIEKHPGAFAPIAGGWGRMGATEVRLGSADQATMRAVIQMAWRNVAPKNLLDDMIFHEAPRARTTKPRGSIKRRASRATR
jgi:uncharacterized protein (DUF1697 family)